LSVTLKHSSRFASYVLIAKGNYPYELNITLPFSLVNNNVKKDRLEVMPAYFWMYNLYALERNSWKALNRDKRREKAQRIEMNYLAPDTAEEILSALEQIEGWMKAAGEDGADAWQTIGAKSALGNGDADEDPEYAYTPRSDEEISAPGLERHKRGAVLLKPRRACAAYREMLHFYAMKTLIAYLEGRPELSFDDFLKEVNGADRVKEWVNLGGQVVPVFRVDKLRKDIREKRVNDWRAVHAAYGEFAVRYPLDVARHAWAVLNIVSACESAEDFVRELAMAEELRRKITEQVYLSRARDFHDPFRALTYRGGEEMREVAGAPEDNFFVKLSRETLAGFETALRALEKRVANEIVPRPLQD
jgi:hypothetical protein